MAATVSEEQLAKWRLENEEQRRKLLAIHYHNANLYAFKLREALEKIREAAELDDNPDEKIAQLAKEALSDKMRPPSPLEHFYDQGPHTGHPYPEYMELPMHEYINPHKDSPLMEAAAEKEGLGEEQS
jgi:hypothetical protein